MLSGIIVIAAFGLIAGAGLVLVVSLCRISGRGDAVSGGSGGKTDLGGG